MTKKPELTLIEFHRMGARALLKKYGRKQLRAWGKLGGRPRKYPVCPRYHAHRFSPKNHCPCGYTRRQALARYVRRRDD